MEKTVADWSVILGIVETFSQANELCYIGTLRLNGSTCSAYKVPKPGDVLSLLTNSYQYQIPQETMIA